MGLLDSGPLPGRLPGDVYVSWTDNRDGAHDVPNPVTDTNVFLWKSTDEGQTWSAPIRVTSGPADKWFPWVTARGGTVEVLFQDGTYDWPNRNLYRETLATSTNGGATWSYQEVDTSLSDPNHSVWFQAHAADCPTCSRFIGDYIGASIEPRFAVSNARTPALMVGTQALQFGH